MKFDSKKGLTLNELHANTKTVNSYLSRVNAKSRLVYGDVQNFNLYYDPAPGLIKLHIDHLDLGIQPNTVQTITLTAKNLVSRTLASFLQSYGPEAPATASLRSKPFMQKMGALLCCKDNSICSTVLYGSPITKAGYYNQEPHFANAHFPSMYSHSAAPPFDTFTTTNDDFDQNKHPDSANKHYQQSEIFNNNINLGYNVQEQPIMTTSIHEEGDSPENSNMNTENFNLAAYYIPKIYFNSNAKQETLSSSLDYDTNDITGLNTHEVTEHAMEEVYRTDIANSSKLEKTSVMYVNVSTKNAGDELSVNVSPKSESNSIKRVKDYPNK